MTNRRLLLLSNGSELIGDNPSELFHSALKDFLGAGVRRVLFVPFAAVISPEDGYRDKVRRHFGPMGYEVESLHEAADARAAVERADAIAVGGGNTFKLLRGLYEAGVVELVRERVLGGALPYVGWSAGSNVACPTIRTTNDMPIVEPPTFDALGLVPFQLNPHYTDYHPPGHMGETRYDLREGFPIVTTKRVPFRWVAEELFWFLSGDTNEATLRAAGVDIWKEWADLEHTRRFGREEGDLGPVYGYLWRSFGGHYPARDGVDQIARLVEELGRNLNSRRLIVTGWDPRAADAVDLPPCHTLFQFKVERGRTLHCQLYQRSADAFLFRN